MFANNPYNEVIVIDFAIENQQKYLVKMECMMKSSLR